MKNTPSKDEVARQIWLNYYNQALYEKGVITEAERNLINNKINRTGSTPTLIQ